MHDSTVMPSECHLVVDGDEICGRVTSIARSPTLGHVIGMAYMRPDQTTPGTVIDIRVEGRLVQAEVAKLPFYDPSNATGICLIKPVLYSNTDIRCVLARQALGIDIIPNLMILTG